MSEVTVLCEDHRRAGGVAGLDHVGVAFGAAGLDHGGGAGFNRPLGAVGAEPNTDDVIDNAAAH